MSKIIDSIVESARLETCGHEEEKVDEPIDVEAEELAADDTVLLDCPGVVLVTFGGVCGKHLHNSS
jgi:hypothetical protein